MIRRGCGKNLRRFRKSCHVRCLETEASPRKNRGFERERIRFEAEVTVESSFDLETFSTLNIQHSIFDVKIWHFSGSVCYF